MTAHREGSLRTMRRHVERFLRGESRGAAAAVARLPLIPPGILFGAAAALRRTAYRRGWCRSERLPVPVVSVGNLTLGGTGKTPFVRMLARMLVAMGERPLVAGRGYGAPVSGSELDEEGAALVRDLEGVPVVQAPDRASAVHAFLEGDQGVTVVVLDDGAQHLQVHRECDIVLIDATCPFGSGWPLPAGNLREFPRALRRMDVVVVTRSDEVDPDARDALVNNVRKQCADGVVLLARHAADRLLPGGEDPESLRGRRVHLLSGIANPESFRRLVERLGAVVTGVSDFPDHHAFTRGDMRGVRRRARKEGAELVLGTGKDAPKVAPLAEDVPPHAFLEVALALDADSEVAFKSTLTRCLHAARPVAGDGHGAPT